MREPSRLTSRSAWENVSICHRERDNKSLVNGLEGPASAAKFTSAVRLELAGASSETPDDSSGHVDAWSWFSKAQALTVVNERPEVNDTVLYGGSRGPSDATVVTESQLTDNARLCGLRRMSS